MPELTFDLVKPLIAHTDSDGSYVQVVFRCPVSEDEIPASARITESAGSSIKKEVKRSLWRNIRWSLSRMMYSAFGYGVGGAIGSTVADTAASVGESRQHQPSEAELKEGVLEAFKSVQSRFAWDASNNRFVSASVFKDLQVEFTVIVNQVRITKAWDRAVLARMLAEIASADGSLAEEERELFASFLPLGQGVPTLDELLEKPPLTKADLEETSEDVRHVMWLIAASMALSDETLAKAESERLTRFATALGISAEDQRRGLELAKEYVIDQALELAYVDGKLAEAELHKVLALARDFGITEDRALRLDARCRKRKGIF